MAAHRFAGKPAPDSLLVNVPRPISAYCVRHPDPEDPTQGRVAFGTPGYRRASTAGSFNVAQIGGTGVVAADGWFAARPSGAEDIYCIYVESFLGPEHLTQIQSEAQAIVDSALRVARS